MMQQQREILEFATAFIEVFAVAIIIVGFIRAAIAYPEVLPAENREESGK